MNSSMLSFEVWNELLHLPLRRQAWHLALLGGAFGLVVQCSLFLQWLNPEEWYISRSRSHYPNVEVLFLGNSQLLNINGSRLTHPSLNAALAGSDYSIQLALLQALAPRMPNLRLVVLGLDNVPLQTCGVRNRKGDFKQLIQAGIPWWSIPDTTPLERFVYFLSYSHLLRPLLVGPKLDIDRLQQYTPFRDASLEAKSGTPGPQETKAPPEPSLPSRVRPGFSCAPVEGARKMDIYKHLRQESNNLAGNRKAFESIIRYCAVHGFQPVLVRAPTTVAFWENRPKDWERELADLIAAAENEFKGNVPVWDEEHSGAYPLEVFDDPNHLDRDSGGALFTLRLNERINALLGAPGLETRFQPGAVDGPYDSSM